MSIVRSFGLVGGVASPAVCRIIGGERIRRRYRQAERHLAKTVSDRAGRQDAVVDRILRHADRRQPTRRWLPGRTMTVPLFDHFAARQDRAGVHRRLPALQIADGRRVPPDRIDAGVGSFAGKGAALSRGRTVPEDKKPAHGQLRLQPVPSPKLRLPAGCVPIFLFIRYSPVFFRLFGFQYFS